MVRMSAESSQLVEYLRKWMEGELERMRGVRWKIRGGMEPLTSNDSVEMRMKAWRRQLKTLLCGRRNRIDLDGEKCTTEKIEGRNDVDKKEYDANIYASQHPPSPCLGWARALVNSFPSPYDSQGLSFRAGELIRVTNKSEGGTWAGECRGKRGTFKFLSVEMLAEENPIPVTDVTLLGLLSSIGLASLVPKLELNGFDTINKLGGITQRDLDHLEIDGVEECSKILTVATVVRFLKGERKFQTQG